MTSQRQFKTLVRERMARTGESYTAARAVLLSKRSQLDRAAHGPVGGQQADVAAARNLLVAAGAPGPGGTAMSESMAFGLAGGVGFLYGVFEWSEGPTMTIVARSSSMPDPFLEPLFEHAGVTVTIETTAGTPTAAKRVSEHLAAGTRMLCTVGSGFLPYLGLTAMDGAMSPHVIGVVGGDDSQVLVDDRSPAPIHVNRTEFQQALGGYRQAKHRTVTVAGLADEWDWEDAIRRAITFGVAAYNTPPVPKYAVNVGLRGLKKWQSLLTDRKDAKGWPRLFGSGRDAMTGLTRLTECIDHDYTAPSAGRPLYATFLRESAAALSDNQLLAAAEMFEASGARWQSITARIAQADPKLKRFADLADDRAALLDGTPSAEDASALRREQDGLVSAGGLPEALVTDLCREVAAEVGAIADLERAALAQLEHWAS